MPCKQIQALANSTELFQTHANPTNTLKLWQTIPNYSNIQCKASMTQHNTTQCDLYIALQIKLAGMELDGLEVITGSVTLFQTHITVVLLSSLSQFRYVYVLGDFLCPFSIDLLVYWAIMPFIDPSLSPSCPIFLLS